MTNLKAVPDQPVAWEDLPFDEIPYVGDAELVAGKGPERIIVALKPLTKPLADLKHWPGNANRGDVDFIARSMQANGQFRPILVQKSTNYVIAGNHTLEAARDLLGWKRIALVVQDVGEDAARRIAIADNEGSRRAGWDNEALVAELRRFQDTAAQLQGTGFDQPALDGLVEQLQGPGGAAGPIAPAAFPGVDPNDLTIEHRCPKCHYEWSGNPK